MDVYRSGRAALLIALLAGALAVAAPAQARTQVAISGAATPAVTKFTTTPQPLSLSIDTFFTNDVPDAIPATIKKAVVYFPHGSRVNGALFPSCDPVKLQRKHGLSKACPPGSRLGGGYALGTAEGFESITAHLRVDVYNGPHGKSVLFYIFASNPIIISGLIDAPLQHLNTREWEYKLTLNVPRSLQEIGPEIFAAVKRFSVKVGGTVVTHGVRHGYIEALACPPGALVPVRGVFSFLQEPSVQRDGYIACGGR